MNEGERGPPDERKQDEQEPGERDSPGARLSRGRLLARNTAFTLGGQAATLLAAFVAVPLLVDGLGTARFGVLALAWVVIGYAQVFDLGIGRALTKLTAERIGSGRSEDMPFLFWTALAGMVLMGCLVGAVVALLSPWLVDDVLNVPERLERETLHSFWLLAGSLPLAIGGAALRAHLEAWQRFDLVNAVVIPMAVVTYFGPVLALQLSDSLVAVVGAVVASRVISWVVNLFLVFHITPALRETRALRRAALDALLRFGSWVTATNVVNALMTAADRFLVGAVISVTAVAYFATPYEVVTKLWLVSIALAGVFFPAFALNLASNPSRLATIFSGGIRLGFIALFPITLAIVAFAHEALDLWLGAEFARNSERVMQWLAIGVLISSLNQLASGLVQSGRPDLTAKLALVELPVYLGVFLVVLDAYGIEGAAAAWAARAAVEAVALLLFVRRLSPPSAAAITGLAPVAAAAALAFAVASQLESVPAKAAFLAIALLAFAPLAWLRILGREERVRVRMRLRAARGTA
jgi:O-antigen/teichoic acid export membrane protein